jgi:hypothetical protein
VISGALTTVDWRWIFYINIPIAVFALVMVPRVLPESRMAREGHGIDVPGAVTATGGLVAIVYGLLQAASHPWGSWQVLLPLLGGVALLLVMVALETRTPDPLIPLRFFTNRTRVTSNAASLLLFAAFYGYVVLLTWYMQQVLGYSPLKTGLLWLPLGAGIGAGIGACTALMPRLGVKAVLLVGFLGDFDLAEEATQEAFAIAAERWPRDGAPANPRTTRCWTPRRSPRAGRRSIGPWRCTDALRTSCRRRSRPCTPTSRATGPRSPRCMVSSRA